MAGLSMPEQYERLAGRVSRRRFLAGAAAAGAATALGGPTLWRQAARASTLAEAPHLQFGADPRAQMVVSWLTATAADQKLWWRPEEGDWFGPVTAPTAQVHRLQGETASPTGYHHVVLDGLTAGARYDYLLGEPGSGAAGGTFTTAPAGAGTFSFTAFGDQGTGEKAPPMTSAVLSQDAAFHFHVGDLCYANRAGMGHDDRIPDELNTNVVDNKIWDAWLRDITRVGADRPWMPTVGNHEMEPGYGRLGYDGLLTRFRLPATGATVGDTATYGTAQATYSFDYGNVRFIALDANDANYEIPANHGYLGQRQDDWLVGLLQGARAEGSGIDWIVVGYHQCSYCTNLLHASDRGLRDRWDAFFRSYRVDLVINGHNHSYERAHPFKADLGGPLDPPPTVVWPEQDGPTFITAGSGGNPRVELSAHPVSYVTGPDGERVPERALWSVARYLDLSFVRVDVDAAARTMTVVALKPDGSTIDEVVLTR